MKKQEMVMLTTLVAIAVLAACGKEENTAAAPDNGKITVNIGTCPNNYPTAYYDDDGKKTGYDVEVMRLVEEVLSDKYVFQWYDAEQDAIYTGLSSGKYDVALTNAYYTEERAQNYELPENPIGASPAGLVVRKEDAQIRTLEDAAAAGFKAAPHLAGDGNAYQYQKYNEEHPENPLDYSISDDPSCFTAGIQYVAEGRYDCILYPSIYYETLVTDENGSLHQFADQLSFNIYLPIDTYAVVAKGKTELAEDISKVLGQLKEDGTLSELAVQFYGFDPFDTNSSIYSQE